MTWKTFLKGGARNVNRQRRNPQRHYPALSQHLWFPDPAPVAPVVCGCSLPSLAALGHKLVRILKRLESGQMLQWDKASKSWKWETGGKVKASWLFKLRDMGYANVTQSLWLLTVAGRRLFGPSTDSARLIAAANVGRAA